jgi:uncharacterized delta-60 repeat protein
MFFPLDYTPINYCSVYFTLPGQLWADFIIHPIQRRIEVMLRRLKDTASTRNIALYAVTILFAVSIAFAQPGKTPPLRLGNLDSRAHSGSEQFPNGLSQSVDKHRRGIAALPSLSVFTSDSTFATNGSREVGVQGGSGTLDAITGLAVQSDGKIVAAGYSKIVNYYAFAVARFNTNGTLDATFGSSGSKSVYIPGGSSTNDQAKAVAIQPSDGKIVAAGYSKNGSLYTFALARFKTNGTLDSTFGTNGGVRVYISGGGGSDDEAYCIGIQSDGKIVAAGLTYVSSSTYIAVARFKTNGAPDSTFGTNGSAKFAYGQVFGLAVQSDGKIVLGAQGFNAAVIGRLKTNGTADSTFGTTTPGWTNTTSIGPVSDFIGLGAIALQSDGKIVAGGYSSGSEFVVARYNALGTVDASFGQSGAAQTFISGGNQSGDEGYAMTLQSDGNIVVAGYSSDASGNHAFAAARWSTGGVLQGSIRTSVSGGDGANDAAQAIAVDSSGRIVLGGFSEYNSSNYHKAFGIARYNCPNSKVLTLCPAAVAETTATLSGEVLAGSPNSVVQFLYGNTSGAYTDSVTASTSPVNSSSTVYESGSLNSLTMGSTYYCCIAASNAYTYLRGKEVCFATSAAEAGYALSFSPPSSTYAIHSPVITTITDNLTMEAWVKWNGGTGSSQDILYNGDPASSGYGLYFDLASGSMGILCGGITFMHSDSVFAVGSWVHLAAVRQSGTWSWYINGVSQPISGGGTAPATPGVDFTVGGYKTHEYFNGVIDEVRISDTIRYFESFSPVHQAFASDPHTIALYHFDEGAGTTAYDASGNANHLTLVNSPAWVTSDAPLPITLASFTGSVQPGPSVQIVWSTVSETNSYSFTIQRKAASSTIWTTVSPSIQGAGTTLEQHNYSWTDLNVPAGTYQYRLEEQDRTGQLTYSSTITIIVSGVTGVKNDAAPRIFQLNQNYPDPFNPTTAIKFSVDRLEHATVRVYSMLGQEVATLFDGMAEPGHYYRFNFDGSQIGSGMYFYRIMTESHSAVKKMILMK